MLNFFSGMIKKTINSAPKITLIVLVTLLLLDVPVLFFHNESLLFFSVGYYLVKYHLHISDVQIIPSLLCAILYGMCIIIDFITQDLMLNNIIHLCSIIIGMIFFVKFTTVIQNKTCRECILWASRFCFPVYLFHEMNLRIIKKIVIYILPQTAMIQLLEYFCIPAAIIFLCIVCSLLLNKVSPGIYSLVTGERAK